MPPTFGIEEEFMLCDAESGELLEDAEAVLDAARVLPGEDLDHELRAPMLETGTAVCTSVDEAARQLIAQRQAAVAAASQIGARLVATGSHPWAAPTEVAYANEPRYLRTADRFGPVADESLVCGCHVHVGVPDRETGVHVLDRIRCWLAPLVALSANSPMWQGADTGYDSWRTQVWSRFPTAGPTTVFNSLDRYDAQAAAMVASGAAIDRAGLYYDARLSEQWPTVEVRVADVCLDVDDAVLLGVMVRALVVTAQRSDASPPDASVELLRAATFMASRWGLGRELVDPIHWRAQPARSVIDALVHHLREALEDLGDTRLVEEGLERLARIGNGANRQRAAAAASGRTGVFDLITVTA